MNWATKPDGTNVLEGQCDYGLCPSDHTAGGRKSALMSEEGRLVPPEHATQVPHPLPIVTQAPLCKGEVVPPSAEMIRYTEETAAPVQGQRVSVLFEEGKWFGALIKQVTPNDVAAGDAAPTNLFTIDLDFDDGTTERSVPYPDVEIVLQPLYPYGTAVIEPMECEQRDNPALDKAHSDLAPLPDQATLDYTVLFGQEPKVNQRVLVNESSDAFPQGAWYAGTITQVIRTKYAKYGVTKTKSTVPPFSVVVQFDTDDDSSEKRCSNFLWDTAIIKVVPPVAQAKPTDHSKRKASLRSPTGKKKKF